MDKIKSRRNSVDNRTPYYDGFMSTGNLDYWQDEDPDYPCDDWKYEVANDDTRLGYWEWVAARGEV
jgi:hypothetical protein